MRWPVRSIRASFLKLEVDEFAWECAFVTLDRRRRRELREAVAMPAQEARDGGLGELGGASDLEARQLAAAQSEDAGDAQRVSGSGGTLGPGRTILEPGGSLGAEAGEPFVGAALRDPEARRHHRDGLLKIDDAMDHLGSTQRGEFGLTVGVHAAVVLGSVLLSQTHLSKSSPHEQPIGTSHLGSANWL